MDRNTEKIIDKLPEHLQQKICRLPEETLEQLEEIRIKAGQDTFLISGGRELSMHDRSRITPEVMEEILNRLLDYSYYAYEDELSKGYITMEGGHRVGICGRVTLKEEKVHLIKEISSLNIRRSRQIIGASQKIIRSVCCPQTGHGAASKEPADRASCLRNTLIVSPPKCGKTTILRDLARNLSNRGYRVAICDERSEIAGSYNGTASYDLGSRTDVLDGCPKAEGILMLIRSMSPDVIITDEIGKPEDARAIEAALCAGVKIITSIHGNSYEDIAASAIGSLVTEQVFETLIFLAATPQMGTVRKVLQLSELERGA